MAANLPDGDFPPLSAAWLQMENHGQKEQNSIKTSNQKGKGKVEKEKHSRKQNTAWTANQAQKFEYMALVDLHAHTPNPTHCTTETTGGFVHKIFSAFTSWAVIQMLTTKSHIKPNMGSYHIFMKTSFPRNNRGVGYTNL